MITTGVRNIIIGTMITTQCGIFGSSANTAYELVDKNNYNKVNHELKIKNNLADIKFKQLIQTCEEYKTIKDYEIEKEKKELERQKQLQQEKENIENSNISNSISEEKINFICSFYSGSDEENGGQTLTASGQSLREGIVASNNFKFGTRIHIDKLGEYQVEDTGNPNFIKQINENTYKIDVYVNSSEEAERLGVIKSTGYIIK